jgi:prolipoprotein diacylglyceryltransferase
MTFPVEFNLFDRRIPAHGVFEIGAYVVGFQTYLLTRRKQAQPIAAEQMIWIIVAAVFGALFGSKLLAFLESFRDYWPRRADPAAWIGGKTIVGGLLGGWAGVEIVKKILHVTRRTGDGFVIPLCLGIAIGRIGCFLTGLADHTHGVATSLPWAVDFGDGVPRHPTQIYEIVVVLALAAIILITRGRMRFEGEQFRWFIVGYLSFRLAVEFIKPSDKPALGLSAIQLASALGIVITVITWRPTGASGNVAEHPG